MTRTGLGREILERLIKERSTRRGSWSFVPPGREHPAFDPGAEERCRAEARSRKHRRGATAECSA